MDVSMGSLLLNAPVMSLLWLANCMEVGRLALVFLWCLRVYNIGGWLQFLSISTQLLNFTQFCQKKLGPM